MWEFRDLFVSFMRRDLTLRYRQTALGVIWVVMQPLLAAGIFAFVFGRIAKLDSGGVPYVLFAYTGMVGWTVFSSTLTKAAGSLVGNSGLLSKVYFPRVLLPLAVLGSTLIDLVVSLLVLVILMSFFGVAPSLALLTFPVFLVLLVVASTGAGLFCAAVMARYRDVQYVLPVVIQLLLYITPVAYALGAAPASARAILSLNPLTGLLEGIRWSLIGTDPPPFGALLWATVAAFAMLTIGSVVFSTMERELADVI